MRSGDPDRLAVHDDLRALASASLRGRPVVIIDTNANVLPISYGLDFSGVESVMFVGKWSARVPPGLLRSMFSIDRSTPIRRIPTRVKLDTQERCFETLNSREMLRVLEAFDPKCRAVVVGSPLFAVAPTSTLHGRAMLFQRSQDLIAFEQRRASSEFILRLGIPMPRAFFYDGDLESQADVRAQIVSRLGDGPYVISDDGRESSNGGNGVRLDYAGWEVNPSARCKISKFEPGISISANGMVGDDFHLVLPPLEQLVTVSQNTARKPHVFGFSNRQRLHRSQLHQIEGMVRVIGEALRDEGLRGAYNVEFLVRQPGTANLQILVNELNPRRSQSLEFLTGLSDVNLDAVNFLALQGRLGAALALDVERSVRSAWLAHTASAEFSHRGSLKFTYGEEISIPEIDYMTEHGTVLTTQRLVPFKSVGMMSHDPAVLRDLF